MELTCRTLALVAQGIHLQALAIVETWRGVTWDILVLTILPCIASMAHASAQRPPPLYQSKLLCTCVCVCSKPDSMTKCAPPQTHSFQFVVPHTETPKKHTTNFSILYIWGSSDTHPQPGRVCGARTGTTGLS